MIILYTLIRYYLMLLLNIHHLKFIQIINATKIIKYYNFKYKLSSFNDLNLLIY
jgi:hypothetical protein